MGEVQVEALTLPRVVLHTAVHPLHHHPPVPLIRVTAEGVAAELEGAAAAVAGKYLILLNLRGFF